ncbi:MAG: glycosyltransferase [Clostridia bacterium]|nr:glycosyltransferase [Clostridia bacterium]
MKLITFTVPCYNSQDYMEKCIESLLKAGPDAEILLVDDGSTDRTPEIADAYAAKYPDIVKVIHKPNGGHGSGLNAGVHAADGLYFKTVDSDDWLDEEALTKLMDTIRQHLIEDNLPDMYICNFIYFHAADNTQHVSKYTKKMAVGDVDWKKVKAFHYSHTLMIHALIYRTSTLRKNYMELPEHTFYVDNIYAYAPLSDMLKAYYLDVDLYYYYIGREGQSINIETAMKRYKQQLLVMEMMVSAHKYDELKTLPKGLKRYMLHYLDAIMMNTLMFACGTFSKERKKDVKEMWRIMKETDKKLYRHLRYRSYATVVAFIPYRLRPSIMMWAYKIICKRDKLG